MPLFCLCLGVSLVFLWVLSFIYGAFWVSVEATNGGNLFREQMFFQTKLTLFSMVLAVMRGTFW